MAGVDRQVVGQPHEHGADRVPHRVRVGRREVDAADRSGEERRLDDCYEEFTFQRRFTEDNPADLLQEVLELSTNLNGISWEELEKKGFERFTEVGMGAVYIGNAADIEPVYIRTAPTTDGWSNAWDIDSDVNGTIYTISSITKDSTAEGSPAGGTMSDFDCDIIFVSGQFWQWPQGAQT